VSLRLQLPPRILQLLLLIPHRTANFRTKHLRFTDIRPDFYSLVSLLRVLDWRLGQDLFLGNGRHAFFIYIIVTV